MFQVVGLEQAGLLVGETSFHKNLVDLRNRAFDTSGERGSHSLRELLGDASSGDSAASLDADGPTTGVASDSLASKDGTADAQGDAGV